MVKVRNLGQNNVNDARKDYHHYMSTKLSKRGRFVNANANMSDVKCAHIPKFSLSGISDDDLKKLVRLADKIRLRKNINKYVHGK